MARKVSTKKLVWRKGDIFKVLKDTSNLVLNKHDWPPLSFRIHLVSFRYSRGPLFPNPVSWLGLFFAISYSKAALAIYVFHLENNFWRKLYIKKMQFRTFLFSYKKCVTEKRTLNISKKSINRLFALSSNDFLVNTP